jgi:hypothetical protein
MTVRLRYKLEITVSSTTAEEKDLGNQKAEVLVDTQGEGGTWKTLVAGGATDQQLFLPNVATARFLYVRTTPRDPTQDPVTITLKRETVGGEAIAVKPVGDAREGQLLLCCESLTALYATNADTVDMDVTVIAVGD